MSGRINAFYDSGKPSRNALTKQNIMRIIEKSTRNELQQHTQNDYLFFRWLAVLLWDDSFIKKSKTE